MASSLRALLDGEHVWLRAAAVGRYHLTEGPPVFRLESDDGFFEFKMDDLGFWASYSDEPPPEEPVLTMAQFVGADDPRELVLSMLFAMYEERLHPLITKSVPVFM